MANEGSIQFSLYAAKGSGTTPQSKIAVQPPTWQFDWTTPLYVGPITLALTTAFASIGKGSITNVLGIYARNLDSAINVIGSLDAGVTSPILLKPGFCMWIPVAPAITIAGVQFKSASGTPAMEYAVIGV